MSVNENVPQPKTISFRLVAEGPLTPRKVIPALLEMRYLFTCNWLMNCVGMDMFRTYIKSGGDPLFQLELEKMAGLRLQMGISPETEELESPDRNVIELAAPEVVFPHPRALMEAQRMLKEEWRSRVINRRPQ